MDRHKKVAAGAAALSVVALATVLGTQPAQAETICTTFCGGGGGGSDQFLKFTYPGGSVDVFVKLAPAPENAFQKVALNLFPGVTTDVFLKYDEFLK